ncbi:hypothetical protein [Neisseria sp. HMSC70E02]|jgi:hypothetical protein|uniref:hypothetical protein n=1 Tax=Neisseria sp. HMSC70E02 TaxID=1608896 RepID=UPI0008A8E000|nr:hypothetical protein [Neisseria sp. HMSC70E02]OHR74263.1 hypothetical protein HMPREF3277_09550 [Neisseria sp. HMSC70E02]
MNDQQAFADMVFQKTTTALAGLPEETRDDVYALSFWLCGGDEWLPSLLVSYNTRQQFVKKQGETHKQDDEAKWNYAYWLQDEAELLGVDAYGNNQELRTWLENAPFAYTEEQYEAMFNNDDEDIDEKSDEFYQAFIETQIAVVQRLFAEGVIARTFGKNIPVLVHELEYYDVPLAWTERANPKGLADEFLSYWRNQ